jgi:hypothetical protein
MSDEVAAALVGSLLGGVIGGTLAAFVSVWLADHLGRSRRRRELQSRRIRETVAVLEAWAVVARGTLSYRLGGTEAERFSADERSLVQLLARTWEWSPDLIPGPAAAEFEALCQSLYFEGPLLATGPAEAQALSDRIVALQQSVRAAALRRLDELA